MYLLVTFIDGVHLPLVSSDFDSDLACVPGARRGQEIGEIRRALERKGSAWGWGEAAPAASPLFGSYFTVVSQS